MEDGFDAMVMMEPPSGGTAGASFPYERLIVYDAARQLRKRMVKALQQLPKDERFGLGSQLSRNSSSVVLNIVEGSLRQTGKEQARFTEIAFGSLHEAFATLQLMADSDYVAQPFVDDFRADVHALSRKLAALRTYQLNRSRSPKSPARPR